MLLDCANDYNVAFYTKIIINTCDRQIYINKSLTYIPFTYSKCFIRTNRLILCESPKHNE